MTTDARHGGSAFARTEVLPEDSQIRQRQILYRRIAWRLIPFLVVCYIFNSIDRTNIGMAQLHLQRDLGFSAAVYGVGVGVFYLGYVFFEVPSNLLLERFGVRKTLLRIMVAWGSISTCMMFVQTSAQFYALRFLLGIAEAGFYPGILLYITYWFPTGQRARVTAMFMVGSPVASVIGAPLSGLIMDNMEGYGGLFGWQWMFLMEGLPAVGLGIVAYFYLIDRPERATWLSSEEKALLNADFAADRSRMVLGHEYGHRELLRDPRIYLLGLVSLGSYTLASAAGFWTPLLLQSAGLRTASTIGFLTAIPAAFTIIIMQLFARHSDFRRERRWHFALAQYAGAVGLLIATMFSSTPLAIVVAICLAMGGTYCAAAVFTNIAAIYLSERTRAGGLAMLTSIGALASAGAPIVMGWLRTSTGEFVTGLSVSVLVVICGATILLLAIPASRLREH